MAREKPRNSWDAIFHDVLLWRPDLDAIVRILNTAADDWYAKATATSREKWGDREIPDYSRPVRASMQIESDRLSFDDLDDVRKTLGEHAGADLKFVLSDIRNSDRFVTVAVSKLAIVSISVQGPEELAALFESLRAIPAQTGTTSLAWGVARHQALRLGLLAFGATAWCAVARDTAAAFALTALQLLAAFAPQRFYDALRPRGAWLVAKDERPDFWRGNADKIVIVLITSVLTLVMKALWDALSGGSPAP